MSELTGRKRYKIFQYSSSNGITQDPLIVLQVEEVTQVQSLIGYFTPCKSWRNARLEDLSTFSDDIKVEVAT
jgi:hypothetical protein